MPATELNRSIFAFMLAIPGLFDSGPPPLEDRGNFNSTGSVRALIVASVFCTRNPIIVAPIPSTHSLICWCGIFTPAPYDRSNFKMFGSLKYFCNTGAVRFCGENFHVASVEYQYVVSGFAPSSK